MNRRKEEVKINGQRKVVTRMLALRPDQIEALKAASKITGKSMSSIVTDMLTEEMETRKRNGIQGSKT